MEHLSEAQFHVEVFAMPDIAKARLRSIAEKGESLVFFLLRYYE